MINRMRPTLSGKTRNMMTPLIEVYGETPLIEVYGETNLTDFGSNVKKVS